MAMFRNAHDAFLMYLTSPDDSGVVSISNTCRDGVVGYRLSNGQVDQYPAIWSIPGLPPPQRTLSIGMMSLSEVLHGT